MNYVLHKLLCFLLVNITLGGCAYSQKPALASESDRALSTVASLKLQYQQSKHAFFPDYAPDTGRYLGTGNGSMSGAAEGSVSWDLHENWQQNTFHPTWFRGKIATGNKIMHFTMQGVFTPLETEVQKYWRFSGYIHFHDSDLANPIFGYHVLPVHGRVIEGEWSHEYYLYQPW